MPKEQVDYEAFFTQLLQRINEIEEKAKANKNKIDLLSSSMLRRNKKIDEEIETIKREINKMKMDLEKIKQRIDYIIAELPNLVRKEDLTAIEKFIALWKPLKFATLDDVERIIERKLKKLSKS